MSVLLLPIGDSLSSVHVAFVQVPEVMYCRLQLKAQPFALQSPLDPELQVVVPVLHSVFQVSVQGLQTIDAESLTSRWAQPSQPSNGASRTGAAGAGGAVANHAPRKLTKKRVVAQSLDTDIKSRLSALEYMEVSCRSPKADRKDITPYGQSVVSEHDRFLRCRAK